MGAPDAAASAAGPPAGSGAAASGPRQASPPRDDRFDQKIAANLPRVPDPAIEAPDAGGAGAVVDNAALRGRIVAFVRRVAAGGEKIACDLPLSSRRPFRAVVWAYRTGEQVGRGEASDAGLCVALKEAARRCVASAGGDPGVLSGTRLVIDLPDHGVSVLEHEGEGLELLQGLVPARTFDRALLARRVDEGEKYLLRVLDAQHKGAHKYYHAPTDTFEPELHTIYTASTALTLLKLHAYRKDKGLLDRAVRAADFMLSMQRHDRDDHTAGAFYYALDLARKEPEPRLVVGTASKSVFTLLELHGVTKDRRYLDAAVLAADWLASMQRPDGSVRSYLRKEAGGRWVVSKKESMLYTGQTLSALSRVHRATGDKKYLDAAALTAKYLSDKVASKGCYVGDAYRRPNPVSSSWVVLSLLDFVKATGDAGVERTVLRCAGDLVLRQHRRPEDAYRHGRFQGSLSSSGNGWLAEVMSEVYQHCLDRGLERCDRFKEAVILTMRLLMQYTYSPQSAFVTKNPEAAKGGVFWSAKERYVRTDSVCHAMNAYLNMMGHLGDGPLVELPEPPLSAQIAEVAPPAPDDQEAADPEEQPASNADEAPDERPGQTAPPTAQH